MVLRQRAMRMTFEILIGRGIACCLYPRAAWRVLTRPGRAFVVAAYASLGFMTTLTILMLL
jgi:hypothetical protein